MGGCGECTYLVRRRRFILLYVIVSVEMFSLQFATVSVCLNVMFLSLPL